MELRHLETLLAIAEEGSFTAAADALGDRAVERVRPGAPARGRARRAAARAQPRAAPSPPSSASLVLDRARRVQRELEAMRADLALLQGLDAGYARLGVVGTASRWLVPALVADLRERAPGVRLRVNEGASERLFAELRRRRARAGRRHRAGRTTADSWSSTCSRRTLIGLVGRDVDAAARAGAAGGVRAVPARAAARPATRCASRSTAPPKRSGHHARPCRSRSRASGSSPTSSWPATTRRSCPRPRSRPSSPTCARSRIAGLPPRRLAMVSARDVQLSLADQAVRDSVRNLVEKHMRVARAAARSRYGRATKRG